MGAPYKYDKDALGFLTLEWTKNSGTYICSNCNEERTSNRSSILKWQKSGVKFCPYCRKSPGLKKDELYYETFLPKGYKVLAVLSKQGDTKVSVLMPCGHEDVYSSRHIRDRQTVDLVCQKCSDNGPFQSLIEKELTEYLLGEFPNVKVELQKPYSGIFSTTRGFIQDVYLPEFDTILEITSKGNNLPDYQLTMLEKQKLAASNNIPLFVVLTKPMIYDIVRSLLKGKERD